MVPLHVRSARSTLRKDVKRQDFPLEVMLACARWYAAYPLSLRNLEEIMAERGVLVGHATVHRWALKILPVLAAVFRQGKLPVGRPGASTRPTCWLAASGRTCIEPSTDSGRRWTSC